MQFKYKAQDKDKKILVGQIDAPDRFSAYHLLHEQGLSAFLVQEEKIGFYFLTFLKEKIDSILGTIKLSEKIIFTKNLAGMINAGLSLYRALAVLEKQTKNKKFKKIISSLLEEINHGGTLSSGMTKFPKVFSKIFVSMVRAGEESGSLAQSLLEVGTILDKNYALTKKVKGAMTYPAIIMTAIGIIAILMFIFVIPTLLKTFKDLQVDLPGSTKMIIAVSDFISGHTFIFLGIIGLLVFGAITFFKSKFTQKYLDFFTVRLPVIGIMIREMNTARMARTLSSLLSSGVAMTKSLEITKEVLSNRYYKETMNKGITAVEKGGSLSDIFKNNSQLYPIMVGEMIEVGEETGKLAQMLSDVAVFFENEVDEKTKNLSTIIEPVLMLVVGAAVGFFAISMIKPLYSLMDSIK